MTPNTNQVLHNPYDDHVFIALLIIAAAFFIYLLIRNIFTAKDYFIPKVDAPDLDWGVVVKSDGYVEASDTFLKYLIFRAESELSGCEQPMGREEIENLIIVWRDDFRHSYYKSFEQDPDGEIRYRYVMDKFIKTLCSSGLIKSLKVEVCEPSPTEEIVLEEA